MSVCCCSLAGTAACQHCMNNPFATDVYSNAVTTDRITVKPHTNYDRIISKSPEELAEWIARIADCCGNDYCGKRCPLFTFCWSKGNASTLDWLKQEVKE